jgi:Subtilase family
MDFNKPHLPLPGATKESYKAPTPGRSSIIPERNKEAHAAFLRDQLQKLQPLTGGQTGIIALKGELLQPQPAQSKKTQSEILAIKRDIDREQTIAIIRATETSIERLYEKINEYETQFTRPRSANGIPKPKHMDFINSIDTIEEALITELFVGNRSYLPEQETEVKWWEVSIAGGEISRDQSNASRQDLKAICEELDVPIDTRSVAILVDSQFFLVKTSILKLKQIIAKCNSILNFRAPSMAIVQYNASSGRVFDVDEVVGIIQRAPENAPRVTVIDTGVNHNHPVFEHVIPHGGLYTVDASSTSTADYHGHGTSVASIAGFGDITPLLTRNAPFILEHFVESVRIPLDRSGLNIKLWGKVTVDAIEEAESNHPELKRVFNLSIGHHGGEFDGTATSWSEAIDKACYNYGNGRLMTIAAGNIPDVNVRSDIYPNLNLISPIESPANSYNAISVGAYTELRTFVPPSAAHNHMIPPANGYHYIADIGELSPHSRTGIAKSIIKPDIVCEGGNFIADASGAAAAHDEAGLCFLTANHRFQSAGQLYCNFWATSKAAPLAARMLAIIWANNPDFLPATIRGLLIHSASWTPSMEAQFRDKNERIRAFGYGRPDLAFACKSALSAVTVIAEDTLSLKVTGGDSRQMVFYKLPWPQDMLTALGSKKVEIRVTLSYFTEPNSRISASFYEGASLGWEMQNPTESDTEFLKRINKQRREEGDSGYRSEIPWQIGSINRRRGSIQADRWKCEAALLATCNHIAVFPKHGWWADKKRERPNPTVDYSLIVSIQSEDETIDLYTSVKALVEVPITATSLVSIPVDEQ